MTTTLQLSLLLQLAAQWHQLSSDVGVNPDLQSSNGFELIRQLTMEYSLRTRSEALSFRTALAHKSFSLHASETSPSTVVTDTIRKIDYENARCGKLFGTLASSLSQPQYLHRVQTLCHSQDFLHSFIRGVTPPIFGP